MSERDRVFERVRVREIERVSEGESEREMNIFFKAPRLWRPP